MFTTKCDVCEESVNRISGGLGLRLRMRSMSMRMMMMMIRLRIRTTSGAAGPLLRAFFTADDSSHICPQLSAETLALLLNSVYLYASACSSGLVAFFLLVELLLGLREEGRLLLGPSREDLANRVLLLLLSLLNLLHF